MGVGASFTLDPDEPLTLERARELLGDQWDAVQYSHFFEGEPPTLGEAVAMLRAQKDNPSGDWRDLWPKPE